MGVLTERAEPALSNPTRPSLTLGDLRVCDACRGPLFLLGDLMDFYRVRVDRMLLDRDGVPTARPETVVAQSSGTHDVLMCRACYLRAGGIVDVVYHQVVRALAEDGALYKTALHKSALATLDHNHAIGDYSVMCPRCRAEGARL